jgi:erythromycin esterase
MNTFHYSYHCFRRLIIISVLCSIATASCEKKIDEPTEFKLDYDKLVQSLESESDPLSVDPLSWTNNDLKFMDQLSEKSIIGLGEATHGTSEFFKAKHRIFRYLVEHNNFKIFAIEADFGESIYINEAIQNSDSASIENLMKTKMLFWTWNTEEVKDLLIWMCRYNSGKPDEDKVQYMGIDCQSNTYNTDILKAYLLQTGVSFYPFAESILDETKFTTEDGFKSYHDDTFNRFLIRIDALRDTMEIHKTEMIRASSEKQCLLHEKNLNVIRQAAQVVYNYQHNNTNYRDPFMAENILWLKNYTGGKKVVIWAHNAHVSNDPGINSLGHWLKLKVNDYETIGFLFSKGCFTAKEKEGDSFSDPKEIRIDEEPQENSVNYIMAQSKFSAFSVRIESLKNHNEWSEAFSSDKLLFFELGAVYNYNLKDCYLVFKPSYWDNIIFFETSTASHLLQ